MNETMHVDIATGDPMTPSSINYRYKCLLTNEELQLKSYNIETILAEKLQTTFERGVANTRSKDYYDIYILYKLKNEEIDRNTLIAAFENTCAHRKTIFTTKQIEEEFEHIKQDASLQKRWMLFTKKNKFAEGLVYADIMLILEKMIEIITDKETAHSIR